ITTTVSAAGPPKLALNRHCIECIFQERCRRRAVERDDLSLLTSLSDAERAKLNNKGIFSITQLSYLFHPRRRPKRQAGRSEKYHHALKALAIREKKVHVVDVTPFSITGTPVFIDIESLPDRDFYYLIGLRWPSENGILHRSLWADECGDEVKVWTDLLDILSTIESPTLIHYGSFEATFFKKMTHRYGGPREDSVAAKALGSAINLLSVIFAHIYFPTYSNSLKQIANYLRFTWDEPTSSGLQSIVWRHEWERSRDSMLKEKLFRYNADDCKALSIVTEAILACTKRGVVSAADNVGIVQVETLGKALDTKWTKFKSSIAGLEEINSAARWDYQRSRVYARPNPIKRRVQKRTKKQFSQLKRRKYLVIDWIPPSACPMCGCKGRRENGVVSRHVRDVVFGTDSVKGRFVNHNYRTYLCQQCSYIYGLDERYRSRNFRYGWNFLSYVIYMIVDLCIPQSATYRSINRLLDAESPRTIINYFKTKAARYYLPTRDALLQRIIEGQLVHVDETRANIKGKLAYVWVLTNLREVVYILTENREGGLVQKLLANFRGVLVSDFYSVYESICCPQQKCLIHLLRDLNDLVLKNPFDNELKIIVSRFSGVLQPIVADIDKRGLKTHFLKKHLKHVDKFYHTLVRASFKSEVALSVQRRLEKNRDRLFTFLRYDGVPWNNNNAEHAIKAFAKLRDVVSGSSTKNGIEEFLVLLSVCQSCAYQSIDFLNFLRSGEIDIATYALNHKRRSLKARDNFVVSGGLLPVERPLSHASRPFTGSILKGS
ncbi:MAG TPA: TM0106 family RecB-like putative nuclease, partial [Candidatus Acidoferrum sp.]|nr:TM0106 family RecB-like putative nuclease [Candidatus Acidoferrum sp.]